ncbi:MAG: hypothetical protein IKR69_05780 [Bacteroidales bacterium]|nr:hypothetical protein [Bacteroidales bacterium]
MKKLILAAVAALALVVVSSCNKGPESLDGTSWSTKENEAGWVMNFKFVDSSSLIVIQSIGGEENPKQEYSYKYSKGKLTVYEDETEVGNGNVNKSDMTFTLLATGSSYILYKN